MFSRFICPLFILVGPAPPYPVAQVKSSLPPGPSEAIFRVLWKFYGFPSSTGDTRRAIVNAAPP